MPVRKIVKIDEDKCNGCGDCVPSCVEGAIQVIDGKARLVSETYCDGLGACLGECPMDAISIEERDAPEFDESAAVEHAARKETNQPVHACPSTRMMSFERQANSSDRSAAVSDHSMLSSWPVQLTLVPPHAPFLKGADILLAADCVPFAYPAFHRDFLQGKSLLIACPKLDDYEAHLEKLTQIFRSARPRSVTVLRMEVPCCGGLTHMVRQASLESGVSFPIQETTIGVRGQILASV
ncbi:ATP-binding protein [Dehalogenimonas etheniformans]|uniref:4Fe-4S ferredoxin n=1 Tax=Dehalogenimonas etheniformans TaxID=1536648 RepID=A0A2P5P9H4_9CHLR|nr:4Fe-4S dicluster domain-containing protein [Dehalogenimonas etheniformans]PPD58958.1 4Fe-4S ferredoxin [Dehalogenimonas etheniformans]QNT76275.1 4Fe-4S binding protein [Dehalogenimonas etheniformans]